MKKLFVGIGLVFVILFLVYHELIVYGIGQGIGQLKVIYYARPIDDMLLDPDLPEGQKKQLRKVGDIRKFAIGQLGLKDSENYTSVYDQKGEPILWIVRACEPYQLKNKTWTFPIVGTVSYKGFFSLEKAKKLRDELNEQGYDTYIREVSAWSTLGWFKDPLMSGVLEGSEGSLANTIIHELTHATIFIKDSLTFNENLASFVGDRGAEEYLIYTYGEQSTPYLNHIQRKKDQEAFTDHFILGAKKLDSLYQALKSDTTDGRAEKKAQMIQSIVDHLDTVTFYNDRYKQRFQDHLPNNAFFMSYLLYRSDQGSLDSLFQDTYNSDLRTMIQSLKSDADRPQ